MRNVSSDTGADSEGGRGVQLNPLLTQTHLSWEGFGNLINLGYMYSRTSIIQTPIIQNSQ